ncbi:dimethylarginine dimethylaminohydrolase family protein [Desulfobaculum sp.]
MFTHAIVRTPCEGFADGITTACELGVPDYSLMLKQHAAYVDTLRGLGLTVDVLPAEPDFPDAHFVEDVAVVTPEVAVITNPGATERNGEKERIVPILEERRPVVRIEAPGTVDGGDVLQVERQFFIGVSGRTNEAGAKQLGDILTAYGYTCTLVPVREGLHLKCGVTSLGGNDLLITQEFAAREEFSGYTLHIVEPQEEYAANALYINGTVITPAGFPSTRKILDGLGRNVVELDMTETRKMDGALTCLSLRLS